MAHRGRKKNEDPGGKVTPRLPPDTIACLEWLAGLKRFGHNKNEVARYLIMREIDDLTRAKVIPLTITQVQQSPTAQTPPGPLSDEAGRDPDGGEG